MAKIHILETGTASLRAAQLVAEGEGLKRMINGLFGKGWSAPLPIYAYLIEHDDGLILVDTGETADVMKPGYFAGWHPYYRYSIRFDVPPAAEIGPQLKAAGFDPADVKTVVLTHLHTDHAGGLRYFPKARILCSATELKTASGFAGRVAGYPNDRWPDWFRPDAIEQPAASDDLLAGAIPVTKDGAVKIVATPGHTLGHLSVAVDMGDKLALLAGDASYTADALMRRRPDGLGADPAGEIETHKRILALAARRPLVYLNGHDPGNPETLASMKPLAP
ncbi:MAG: N-acyl homoserine lactonase family protein [Hyphomicrobiales bacterium]|nr:N-acyl homoserine lactonase family protein [Hyphomicrobiales bacterium]